MEDLYAVLGKPGPMPGTHPTPLPCFALRWHRVLNSWSQEALGLAAGLDRSYVGAVERVDLLGTEVGGNFR